MDENLTLSLTLTAEQLQQLGLAAAAVGQAVAGAAAAAVATRYGWLSADAAVQRRQRAWIAAWPIAALWLALSGGALGLAWLVTRPALWTGDLAGWLGRPRVDPWALHTDAEQETPCCTKVEPHAHAALTEGS